MGVINELDVWRCGWLVCLREQQSNGVFFETRKELDGQIPSLRFACISLEFVWEHKNECIAKLYSK